MVEIFYWRKYEESPYRIKWEKPSKIRKGISVICVEIFILPYFSEYVFIYQSTTPLAWRDQQKLRLLNERSLLFVM
jgi:hypothetical protein